MLSDLGVTTVLSFVTKMKLAPPGLLHICSCGSVQIHIFIIALLVGVHDGVEAHGIVQTGLYMASAVGAARSKSQTRMVMGFAPPLK